MNRISFLLSSALLGLLAMPAMASTYTPPAGCRLEVTVQNRGCTVSQLYRCDADPEGHQRSAVFDKEGLFHQSRIDAETRWIESSSPKSGFSDRLIEEAENHASLTELLETGRDDFDFWTETETGQRMRHQGFDELTGETVSINGVELKTTRFELTTTDETGEVLMTRKGQQYVSPTFRRFFGGKEVQTDWTGQRRETDDSPVLFIFPGQSGFGSTTPQIDCEQLMTALPRFAS